MTGVCNAVHQANESGKHGVGFCLACSNLYMDLSLLVEAHSHTSDIFLAEWADDDE